MKSMFTSSKPSLAPRTGQCGRKSTLNVLQSYSPQFGDDASRLSSQGPRKQPSKLVIPGQESGKRIGGRSSLILPGGGSSSGSDLSRGGGAGQLQSSSEAPTPAPAVQNFRPPPGFMNANIANDTKEEENVSTDEMLRRLQTQKGHWHQLAAYLPKLQRDGIDGAIVEEMTGIDRRLQNVWNNASMVYLSLKNSRKMEQLEYFDMSGGEHLLYELRFLSTDQRVETANYIVKHELNPQESLVLARAVKEHERRAGEKEGFSASPADCLAFKYYRDALENKKEEDVKMYIQKGLAVVETQSGREALESIAASSGVAVQDASQRKHTLEIIRLMKEEVGYRPVALVGSLQDVRASDFVSVPKVSSSGVFGTFTVPAVEGQQWVPLPAWSILALAGHPVAISIDNCADVEIIRDTTGVKTEKDASKLLGPGILVMDLTSTHDDTDCYYVVSREDGTIDFSPLHDSMMDAHQDLILGKVLFVCRPPSRDSLAGEVSQIEF